MVILVVTLVLVRILSQRVLKNRLIYQVRFPAIQSRLAYDWLIPMSPYPNICWSVYCLEGFKKYYPWIKFGYGKGDSYDLIGIKLQI
jgi:hypothetical protein